ncbi:MAG: hypothetical protein JSS30_06895 [Verrucomicrobia bacterium]|nr:hypothetical protein [Verrucomicrobiota bacterium]
MGNKISLFIMSLIFLGCQMKEKEPEKESYVCYANQIINSFADEMKKEYGLHCSGSGGKMPFDVEEFMIGFALHRHATIEEARELEVAVTEKFVQTINANEKIRPFLRVYPFTPDRARVSIAFQKSNNRPYTDGSVALVFQVRNRIYYNADSETSPTLISLMDEPYDEALKIVNENSKK